MYKSSRVVVEEKKGGCKEFLGVFKGARTFLYPSETSRTRSSEPLAWGNYEIQINSKNSVVGRPFLSIHPRFYKVVDATYSAPRQRGGSMPLGYLPTRGFLITCSAGIARTTRGRCARVQK